MALAAQGLFTGTARYACWRLIHKKRAFCTTVKDPPLHSALRSDRDVAKDICQLMRLVSHDTSCRVAQHGLETVKRQRGSHTYAVELCVQPLPSAVPRFCISEQKSAHLAVRLTHTAGGHCRRSGFDCVQLRRDRRQARHSSGRRKLIGRRKRRGA